MKILGFANKGLVKEALRGAEINTASVRKVVVGNGYLDVFFHNGDNMVRVDAPNKLTRSKKEKDNDGQSI